MKFPFHRHVIRIIQASIFFKRSKVTISPRISGMPSLADSPKSGELFSAAAGSCSSLLEKIIFQPGNCFQKNSSPIPSSGSL